MQAERWRLAGVASARMQVTQEMLDQYNREVELEFEGEEYLVRDNGAVYRIHRTSRRRSRCDEAWTFGRFGRTTGYRYIGSKAVHRIVAVAYHGKPPSPRHVVDHIDANKGNNRADNLRWISKLENLIRHPSTRKQIVDAYGSLDKYFENPVAPTKSHQDVGWLGTFSKAEIEKSRDQLLLWAESDGLPKDGNLANRVYGTRQPTPPIPEAERDRESLNPMAVQRRWKTPTEFPCCPNALGTDPLAEYFHNMRAGVVFSRNRYGESVVEMVAQGEAFLSVLTASKQEDSVKPWAVAKVTVENGKFIHESVGSFFELNGAKKAHFGLLGIPYSGESIDEYC